MPVADFRPKAGTQPDPNQRRALVEQLNKNDSCHHRDVALRANAIELFNANDHIVSTTPSVK
jgi:hypothetical protein